MPPFLTHGKPASAKPEKKRVSLPQPQYLCQCLECGSNQHYDQSTNTVIHGQYLARQQFKDHEAEERRRNIAITRLKNEQFDLANDTHASSCDDYLLGQRTVTTPTSSEAVMEESVDSVSSLADGLQLIRQHLLIANAESFREATKRTPPIFLRPPTSSSVPISEQLSQEIFTLDAHNARNYALLDYERWLMQASRYLDSHNHRGSAHDRLLTEVLRRDVNAESLNMATLRSDEWERQRLLAHIASHTECPQVNTSGFCFFLQFLKANRRLPASYFNSRSANMDPFPALPTY
jgi:hypothetical protein